MALRVIAVIFVNFAKKIKTSYSLCAKNLIFISLVLEIYRFHLALSNEVRNWRKC